MRKVLLVVLVCAVAVAAFLLGRRSGPAAPAPASTPAPVAAPTSDIAPPASAATVAPVSTDDKSALPESQPVRTFRGPDGLPHIIVYDPAKLPDNDDPAQVRAAVLEDMRNHPRNIERAYDLTQAQIAEILAGKRPLPDYMLPKPAAPAAR